MNQELSELFRQLSKLHQSSPLLAEDSWKAYCFNSVAGRLAKLDFEIFNDPKVLNMLGSIKGIGPSTLDKIKEYLETGTLSRIHEFNTDPKRVAMRKMMNIWGVGRASVRRKAFESRD